jgi:hypothetical protein
MDRDPIREWRHALQRRNETWTLGEAHLAAPPQPFVLPPDALDDGSFDLRRSRRLTVSEWQLDLGAAIRLLQRHNKLLRARFGIGWAEVTGMLLGEARRRGVSTENLARVLTAGLRDETRGQRA